MFKVEEQYKFSKPSRASNNMSLQEIEVLAKAEEDERMRKNKKFYEKLHIDPEVIAEREAALQKRNAALSHRGLIADMSNGRFGSALFAV